jgi:hypothetical protein
MKNLLRWAGAIALALIPSAALAQAGSSIQFPAGWAPGTSICVKQANGTCAPVAADNPLPTAAAGVATATSAALTGTATTTSTVGPFTPNLGRVIWLTLSGTFSGSVTLLRSRDGGTTKLALTYSDGTAKPTWTTALNTPVTEETVAGATYYLSITLTSGSVSYRLEQ